MSNKYTKWGDVSIYRHTDELFLRYADLSRIPFFVAGQAMTKYELIRKPKTNVTIHDLSEAEKTLLGILVTGKCMTVDQLLSYLILLQKEGNRSRMKQALDRMFYLGVVARVILYDTDDKRANLTAYVPNNHGYRLGRDLLAPFISLKREHNLSEYYRGWGLFFKKHIVMNQIVLNQILYNPSICHFQISNTRFTKSCGRHVIPLCIGTSDMDYIYIPESHYDYWSLKRLLDLWDRYRKYYKRELTLIILADKEVSAAYIRSLLKRMPSYDYPVWISEASEWFGDAPGTYLSNQAIQ